MNEPSNAPMMPPAPGVAGWLPVWIKAVSKPGEQTFVELTEHPDALAKTAFIWVFIVGTLSAIVNGILQAILLAVGLSTQPTFPGLEQFGIGSGAGGAAGFSLITTVCASPIAGLFSVLGFAIGTAVVQWVAKLFGGAGTFDKLAYALGAITVPLTLVSMFLTPLGAVPYLGICTGLISIGAGIYALVLQVMAVKGVNRFGWGQALGSVFLPALVIGFVCACIVGLGMMVMGPAIGNIFEQINQSLAP